MSKRPAKRKAKRVAQSNNTRRGAFPKRGRASRTSASARYEPGERGRGWYNANAVRSNPKLVEAVANVAAKSALARQVWANRTQAGIGYVKGMAVVFADLYCRLHAGDEFVAEMAKAKSRNVGRDAIAWYDDEFEALKMDNSEPGADVLRHLFVVLYGLGIKISGGKYCKGHEHSVGPRTADAAGAGLFQATHALCSAHPLLPKLFKKYTRDPEGFLDLFREGVVCAPYDWENQGSSAAMEFQRLTKACPLFAVEFAAIALRHRKDHWQAVKLRNVQLLGSCEKMLRQVQDAVDWAMHRQ